jgi:hypothetical protein
MIRKKKRNKRMMIGEGLGVEMIIEKEEIIDIVIENIDINIEEVIVEIRKRDIHHPLLLNQRNLIVPLLHLNHLALKRRNNNNE